MADPALHEAVVELFRLLGYPGELRVLPPRDWVSSDYPEAWSDTVSFNLDPRHGQLLGDERSIEIVLTQLLGQEAEILWGPGFDSVPF